MGNWNTDKSTTYSAVRITKDAKHFAESGEKGTDSYKPAATFLSIVDGTKGGEDIFVDVKVEGKTATNFAGLKKGAELATVTGPVSFSIGNDGKLRGKMYNAKVVLTAATREALKAVVPEAAPVESHEAADDSAAPAFK